MEFRSRGLMCNPCESYPLRPLGLPAWSLALPGAPLVGSSGRAMRAFRSLTECASMAAAFAFSADRIEYFELGRGTSVATVAGDAFSTSQKILSSSS